MASKRITSYFYSLVAAEISTISRYCHRLLQLAALPADKGQLFESIEAPVKERIHSLKEYLAQGHKLDKFTILFVNGSFNHDLDIQGKLEEIWQALPRDGRLVTVTYNPYYKYLYKAANLIGIRSAPLPVTFLGIKDLKVIAEMAGFKVVRIRGAGFIPFPLAGLGTILNRVLASMPLLWRLGITWIFILKPVKETKVMPLVSVVVPARNERENVRPLLEQLSNYPGPYEVIFVEGHSNDGTWDRILEVSRDPNWQDLVFAYQQSGRGKADAVRLGFEKARGEILAILDADRTMPPEYLERFVRAWMRGESDFIHGNRLVYPIEGKGMKPLNWLGNLFFARMLSFVLDTRIGDSLCGTKLLSREDYERFKIWRNDFGDFDPFGDFELLFPATVMGLGITDIPIRYRDRTYGTTNILRFRHGLMLLRMTVIGFMKIRLGQRPVR